MKLRAPERSHNIELLRTMKNVTALSLTIAAIICLLSDCSSAQQLPANVKPLPAEKAPLEKKILVRQEVEIWLRKIKMLL